jgi:predicted PurR-regulated permease PerM
MGKASIEGVSFMAVVVLVTTAFVVLLIPYHGAVLWATIVAILFYPLHEMLCCWFGGRRNLAAATSVICFVCIVLIPGSIVLGSLADEATRLYGRTSPREFAVVQVFQRLRDALPRCQRVGCSPNRRPGADPVSCCFVAGTSGADNQSSRARYRSDREPWN